MPIAIDRTYSKADVSHERTAQLWVRVETTSRTSSLRITMGAKSRTTARLSKKACKRLELGRLGAVQRTGTQNVVGLQRLGPLVLRKGLDAGPANQNQI
jgi:hypothetical protein